MDFLNKLLDKKDENKYIKVKTTNENKHLAECFIIICKNNKKN